MQPTGGRIVVDGSGRVVRDIARRVRRYGKRGVVGLKRMAYLPFDKGNRNI